MRIFFLGLAFMSGGYSSAMQAPSEKAEHIVTKVQRVYEEIILKSGLKEVLVASFPYASTIHKAWEEDAVKREKHGSIEESLFCFHDEKLPQLMDTYLKEKTVYDVSQKLFPNEAATIAHTFLFQFPPAYLKKNPLWQKRCRSLSLGNMLLGLSAVPFAPAHDVMKKLEKVHAFLSAAQEEIKDTVYEFINEENLAKVFLSQVHQTGEQGEKGRDSEQEVLETVYRFYFIPEQHKALEEMLFKACLHVVCPSQDIFANTVNLVFKCFENEIEPMEEVAFEENIFTTFQNFLKKQRAILQISSSQLLEKDDIQALKAVENAVWLLQFALALLEKPLASSEPYPWITDYFRITTPLSLDVMREMLAQKK